MTNLKDQEREVQEQAFLGTAHNRGEVPIGARRSYHREGWIAGRRYEAALAAREEPNVESVSGLTLRCELAGALGVEPEGWLDLLGRVKRLAAREEPQGESGSIEQETRPCFVASNGDLLMLTDEQAENVAKMLAAREDTERPESHDPVLPDGTEESITSLHDALAILSLILLRAKTEPNRADRDRVRLLHFFSAVPGH